MKILRVISLLLLALSCTSDEEQREKEAFKKYAKGVGERVVHGNPEPPMPDKQENSKTLLGVDSDNDGIRDDVEIYINFLMKDESYNKVMAMRMMARGKQKQIKHYHNKEKVIELEKQLSDDRMCLGGFYADEYY